jgi:hypothetical protein
MQNWKRKLPLLAVGLACTVSCLGLALAADAPATESPLVVIDAAGKEQKLKAWKFVAGTRRLSWLAAPAPAKDGDDKDPAKGDKSKTPSGPEALDFREENSTTFRNGILTLVPLDRLRSITYEADKETVSVAAAVGEKGSPLELLTGTTHYAEINKLIIEAEVDKGDLGVAEVKFLGGVPKGVRRIDFPILVPRPLAGEGSRPAVVTTQDRGKKATHKVVDLQPLYKLADGSEAALCTLMFKKTLKLDVAKIQKLRAVEGKDADGTEWGVTLKDAEEETYTLLPKITHGGKSATLEGFVGRVGFGYKLFPPHTIAEILFDDKGE